MTGHAQHGESEPTASGGDTPGAEPGNSPPALPPPLGSWARIYTLVLVVAVLVVAALWWLSATYNVPLEAGPR